MTEQERLFIIGKINDKLRLVELLNLQKEKLKELEKSKKEKMYSKLLNQVTMLIEKTSGLKSMEDIVSFEFSGVLTDENRVRDFSRCNHDIWMYYGSYGMLFNSFSCNPRFIDVKNEWDNNFSFNKYICLECGEVIKSSDWKYFEKENIVLKNESESFDMCHCNFLKYQQLYYKLLYNYSIEEANDLIVKEFYKGRRYPKRKIRK